VTPGSQTIHADELAVGGPVTVSRQYSVTCGTAGAKTVTVSTSVVPEKAKVVDLFSTNNSQSATFSVDCAVPVTLNVKPGSLRNPVNRNEGAIPMAVLTTSAGEYGNPLAFDATAIQGASVRVGARTALVGTNTGAPETHGRIHLEDVVELDRCLDESAEDWAVALPRYAARRKPHTDAIADLALENFVEMRDKVASPVFRLGKRVEHAVERWAPERFDSLYELVSFSTVPYAEARRRAAAQRRFPHNVAAVAAAGAARLRAAAGRKDPS